MVRAPPAGRTLLVVALAASALVLLLVASAPPVAAAPADAQVTDPAGDVQGPDGTQDRGPADDWPDVVAVWVAGETEETLEFHVEAVGLPPYWNEATDDRPAEPYRVAYTIAFNFFRPAAPGVAGFEEPVREDHVLTVTASRGFNMDKPGDLIVGGGGCLWNGQPGTADAERVSATEVLCRLPRDLVLPKDAGGTFYAGDALVAFNATGSQDHPPLADPAPGSGTYAFQVVEPLPAPATEDGEGGPDGGARAGGSGSDSGSASGNGTGGAGGGGDGSGGGAAGDGADGSSAPGDAAAPGSTTPGPGAALAVAGLAAAGAAWARRARRRRR